MNCVFFGSPDFAVASLEALLSSKHRVVGVITQPDRASGRGMQLEAPAVKKYAISKKIPLLQPEKINSPQTLSFLEECKPDILVVVAYGGFLGKELLGYCSHPPINVHPSLLPDLRGAAPMQWAILRGYEKSGITTQFMVKEMDAGDILLQEELPIHENETAKDLHDRWKHEGGKLLVKTLDQLEAGVLSPKTQMAEKATLAPLLTKELGAISWSKESAKEIHNKARGLFPWPGAYTSLGGKRIKILRTKIVSGTPKGFGAFWEENSRLFVGCKDGIVELLELQPEGKRAMLPKEFMNGIRSGNQLMQFDGV